MNRVKSASKDYGDDLQVEDIVSLEEKRIYAKNNFNQMPPYETPIFKAGSIEKINYPSI